VIKTKPNSNDVYVTENSHQGPGTGNQPAEEKGVRGEKMNQRCLWCNICCVNLDGSAVEGCLACR